MLISQGFYCLYHLEKKRVLSLNVQTFTNDEYNESEYTLEIAGPTHGSVWMTTSRERAFLVMKTKTPSGESSPEFPSHGFGADELGIVCVMGSDPCDTKDLILPTWRDVTQHIDQTAKQVDDRAMMLSLSGIGLDDVCKSPSRLSTYLMMKENGLL